MKQVGWIKLYRELLDKPIWKESTAEQKAILITLLLMANHEKQVWEWKGKEYTCDAGQFITSLENLAQAVGKGVSKKNVRTALERFEKLGFITKGVAHQRAHQRAQSNTLISICNWETYQGFEEEGWHSNGHSNGHITRIYKNNIIFSKENDSLYKGEENFEKIEKRGAFSPPSIDEVKEYADEKDFDFFDAERFVDFYTAKDWMIGKNKMKDWRAVVRNWAKSDKKTKSNKKRSKSAYQQRQELERKLKDANSDWIE